MVSVSPEQTQTYHALFRANAILVEAIKRECNSDPNSECMAINDLATGEEIIGIDELFLKVLKGFTWGLHNELAHPLQQVLEGGQAVLKSGNDGDAIRQMKEELAIIQNPSNPIDLQMAINP